MKEVGKMRAVLYFQRIAMKLKKLFGVFLRPLDEMPAMLLFCVMEIIFNIIGIWAIYWFHLSN